MMSNRIQAVTQNPGENAMFIVLGLSDKPETVETVLGFISGLAALTRSLRVRYPDQHLNSLVGFGSHAWDILFPQHEKPKELVPFQEIKGPKYTAVATPGDLFFHLRADNQALCYELASLIHQELKDVTYSIDEVQGFRYFEGRAIIGFVDGTENPESDVADYYAVVGDEDPAFKGGSYAFVQKYIHNMDAWNALSDAEQELIIGRKKLTDIELSDDEKPGTAHTNVSKAYDEEGNELKIMRANVPFSHPTKGEYGTYFIGYARHFSTTKQMLEHMFQGNDEGHLDRLLDFSTAKTGSLFFVPCQNFLDDCGDE